MTRVPPSRLAAILTAYDRLLMSHVNAIPDDRDAAEALLLVSDPYLLTPAYHRDPAVDVEWTDGHTAESEARIVYDPASARRWAVIQWVSPDDDPATHGAWMLGRPADGHPLTLRPLPANATPLYTECWPQAWYDAARRLAEAARTYTDGCWRAMHWASHGRHPRMIFVYDSNVPDHALSEPSIADWLGGGPLTATVAARLATWVPGMSAADWLSAEAKWLRLAPPIGGVRVVWEVESSEHWEPSYTIGRYEDPALAAEACARANADEADEGSSARSCDVHLQAIECRRPSRG